MEPKAVLEYIFEPGRLCIDKNHSLTKLNAESTPFQQFNALWLKTESKEVDV